MSLYKFIYFRDDLRESYKKGFQFANIHILKGYGDNIKSFLGLVKELRKTFPKVKISDIYCGKVTKSSYCKGFSIIHCLLEIKIKEYKGFEIRKKPDYYFD